MSNNTRHLLTVQNNLHHSKHQDRVGTSRMENVQHRHSTDTCTRTRTRTHALPAASKTDELQ